MTIQSINVRKKIGVKFTCVIFETRKQTDRQTDKPSYRHVHYNASQKSRLYKVK